MSKHKRPQNTTKHKLMSYHYEAVELRYQGKKHREISLLLQAKHKRNFREDKIRSWFASRGLLETEYLDYAKKENDRRRKRIIEEMKKITVKLPEGYDLLISTLKEQVADPKSASVFRQTLKDLTELLGFKIEDGAASDPLDDFFNKSEEEIIKKRNGKSNT